MLARILGNLFNFSSRANILDVSKFLLFEEFLHAAAATAISGISVINDDYEMVIEMLKEKFGKRDSFVLLIAASSTGNESIQQYKIYLRSHGEDPASTRGTERECQSTDQQRMLV